MPAVDVALLRTMIGGSVAIPIAWLLGIKLPKDKQQLYLLCLSGFCGFVGFPIMFTLGVLLTSANHASMILASLPIFTGAIAMIWDRQVPHRRWWTGCVVALIGEGILISTHTIDTGQSSVSGDLLVLGSNVFASIGYVAGGRLQRSGYSARGTTFWGVAIFAVLLTPTVPFLLDFPALAVAPLEAWAGVVYLAIGVTIIGYILWYWALGSGGIARVGLLQFLQPISGVVLAGLLLAEQVNSGFLMASAVVFCGVWLALG